MVRPLPETTTVAEAPDAAPPASRAARAVALARRAASGMFSLRVDKSASRVALVGLAFVGLFGVIGARLVTIALWPNEASAVRKATSSSISAARPDIVDRNGETLATDVRSVSAFVDPKKVIDKDEAVELITAVLPDLDAGELRERLGMKRGFVWVKREITPRQQSELHRLGIPTMGFLPENKRVYPNGSAAAHVLGFANIDNIGIAGLEKYIDSQGLHDPQGAGLVQSSAGLKPVQISIDLRVQHALRDELQ